MRIAGEMSPLISPAMTDFECISEPIEQHWAALRLTAPYPRPSPKLVATPSVSSPLLNRCVHKQLGI